MTTTRTFGAAVAALVLLSIPAKAQQDAIRIDPRWRAFLGCWNSVSAQGAGPLTCFVPTASANTVALLTVSGDSILTRTTIVSSGDRVRVRREGCTGWESARWSADDRRLYTTAELTCDDGATQQLQSLYSMSHGDQSMSAGHQFTRIDGLKTQSGQTAVRLLTFDATASDPLSVPAEIADRLPPATSTASYAARVDAAAPLSLADITDAAQALDASVVQAWLVNRGETFTVNARDLRAMRDSKVPPGVIDMVVAIANPTVFRVAQNRRPEPTMNVVVSGSNDTCRANPGLCNLGLGGTGFARSFGFGGTFDPFYGFNNGWNNGFGAWDPFFGSGFYNPTFASCSFGFHCNGFGWQNGWQTGWQNGGQNGGPFVIVPSGSERIPGRAVNGSGYSQGGSSDGVRVAMPSPSVSNGGGYSGGGSGGSGGSGGGSGSASGGGYSGGGSSSSSGGEQRTAKPRP